MINTFKTNNLFSEQRNSFKIFLKHTLKKYLKLFLTLFYKKNIYFIAFVVVVTTNLCSNHYYFSLGQYHYNFVAATIIFYKATATSGNRIIYKRINLALYSTSFNTFSNFSIYHSSSHLNPLKINKGLEMHVFLIFKWTIEIVSAMFRITVHQELKIQSKWQFYLQSTFYKTNELVII